jgi:hypothetical protein
MTQLWHVLATSAVQKSSTCVGDPGGGCLILIFAFRNNNKKATSLRKPRFSYGMPLPNDEKSPKTTKKRPKKPLRFFKRLRRQTVAPKKAPAHADLPTYLPSSVALRFFWMPLFFFY